MIFTLYQEYYDDVPGWEEEDDDDIEVRHRIRQRKHLCVPVFRCVPILSVSFLTVLDKCFARKSLWRSPQISFRLLPPQDRRRRLLVRFELTWSVQKNVTLMQHVYQPRQRQNLHPPLLWLLHHPQRQLRHRLLLQRRQPL